jgi:hypothetical protein
MKFSKATAIPILLIIVLGAIGFSYAWWTETLVIDDNVNTGELKLSWGYTGGLFPPSWTSVTREILDNTLKITMGNMYPGAEVKFYIGIYNTGTIPAKITGYRVARTDGDETLYNNVEVKYSMVHWYPGCTGSGKVVVYATDWMDINSLEAHLNANGKTYPYPPGPYGTTEVVLKPGDYLKFDEDTLYFRVNPNAGNEIEGKSVTFKIEVDFTQWNAP